ncbi:hypothetical protein GCM10020258_15380 [Sphingomonas yabuuchiae]
MAKDINVFVIRSDRQSDVLPVPGGRYADDRPLPRETPGEKREQDWYELSGDGEASPEPAGERVIGARQEVAKVAAVLARLGARREAIFRRARIDGVSQRQIAAELGVSLSTVEADLRIATRALIELKDELQ